MKVLNKQINTKTGSNIIRFLADQIQNKPNLQNNSFGSICFYNSKTVSRANFIFTEMSDQSKNNCNFHSFYTVTGVHAVNFIRNNQEWFRILDTPQSKSAIRFYIKTKAYEALQAIQCD